MEHCQRSHNGSFLIYHASGIANLLRGYRGCLAFERRCKLPGLVPAVRKLGTGVAELDDGNQGWDMPLFG